MDNFPRNRGHLRDFPLKVPPFWANMLKSARFSLNFKGFHLILVDLARKPRYLVLGAIFTWKRQFVSAAPLSIHQFQMSLFISTFFVSVFGFSFVAFGFSLFSSAAPTSVRAAASARVPLFPKLFPLSPHSTSSSPSNLMSASPEGSPVLVIILPWNDFGTPRAPALVIRKIRLPASRESASPLWVFRNYEFSSDSLEVFGVSRDYPLAVGIC